MNVFLPITIAAVTLGAIGVAIFFWAMRSGQYDDLDGAAERILIDDEADQIPTEK
ncbi:MAG: cbb3-type cytochrome oxidase assembly protein CcoS [Alphaproteobacteria bacterium]|nr:cbb3-type cytochrome oxidase assembly protein CcoS [Alphaproteobacteria bacterium]